MIERERKKKTGGVQDREKKGRLKSKQEYKKRGKNIERGEERRDNSEGRGRW